MTRLTESVVGLTLLILTLLCGAAGLIADLTALADAPALFGAAAITGVAAIAVALDEGRQLTGRAYRAEILFGRVLVGVALALGLIATVTGLQDTPERNLWLILALIVALDAVAVIVDSRRLILARGASIKTRPLSDGVLGAIAAGVGFGFGIFGFIAGLLANPHAAALLHSGVVLAILAVALMFDEQAHVAARVRAGRPRLGR